MRSMEGESESIILLFQQIKEEKMIVIVEGKKDKLALLSLGIGTNQIRVLDKPLYAVVEETTYFIHDSNLPRKIALLTDLDTTGKKLYMVLKRDFNKHGIVIDDTIRNFLFKNTKLRQIEGLTNYLEKKKCL